MLISVNREVRIKVRRDWAKQADRERGWIVVMYDVMRNATWLARHASKEDATEHAERIRKAIAGEPAE